MRHLCKTLLCLLVLPLYAAFLGCGVASNGSFSLGLDRSAVTLARGATTTVSVTASGANNFKGSVYIAVNGLPAGVTISPANATIAAGATQQFTLNAASGAAAGNVEIDFAGTSGTLSSSASLALTISVPTGPPATVPDFTLAVDPSISITAGNSGQVTLTATAVSGFSGTVAITASGLPAEVTLAPATITLTPGTPQPVTINVPASAVAATTSVSFTGTSGALTHIATTALTITSPSGPPPPTATPDFQISLTPATVSVTAGGTAQTVVAITALNGFTDNVALAVSGLPAGVTASPMSTQVAPGTPQAVVFTAPLNIAGGTSTVTFTGTDGSLVHTATLTLTVVTAAPAPDFTFTVNPTSLNVAVGATAQAGLTATGVGGFNGNVNVAITGLPAGPVK